MLAIVASEPLRGLKEVVNGGHVVSSTSSGQLKFLAVAAVICERLLPPPALTPPLAPLGPNVNDDSLMLAVSSGHCVLMLWLACVTAAALVVATPCDDDVTSPLLFDS